CKKVPAELEFGSQLKCSSPIFIEIPADSLTLTRLPFFHRCYCFIHFICCLFAVHPHTLPDSLPLMEAYLLSP
ncbi:hypothetical protein GOODEAATRI_029885, partial [Goodea atripinnis]